MASEFKEKIPMGIDMVIHMVCFDAPAGAALKSAFFVRMTHCFFLYIVLFSILSLPCAGIIPMPQIKIIVRFPSVFMRQLSAFSEVRLLPYSSPQNSDGPHPLL